MNYFTAKYALGVLNNEYTLTENQENSVPPLYYSEVKESVEAYKAGTSTELLEEAKKLKLNEIYTVADKFSSLNKNKDMVLISSLGFKINADKEAKGNLKDLIDVGTEPVLYRVYDNSYQSLTLDQLKTLWSEVIANGNNLYKQKWEYETSVNECTTIEEVQKITPTFTMMDFSQPSTVTEE